MLVRCRSAILALFLCLVTSACAMSPGPEVARPQMCNLPRHQLSVEVGKGSSIGLAGSDGQSSLADAIWASYSTTSTLNVTGEPISLSMLFLSGGSQHGAFGAGYLHGWATARSNGQPHFRVVTGISTRAILSNFAFLDRTADPVREYAITSETRVLQPFVKNGSNLPLMDALAVARKGAMGDLAPLRARMRTSIDDATLRAVAAEADVGRRLFTGAVDVDLGQAVAVDMTALA